MSWFEIYLVIIVATFVLMSVVILGDGNVRACAKRNNYRFVMFPWLLICAIIWPVSIWPVVFNVRTFKEQMIETLDQVGGNNGIH